MNWGKGITIALVLFIGFIVTLGTILMRQDVDLVAEDYYQQEINYETQITAESNAKKLDEQPTFVQNEDHFIVQIPDGEFTKMTLDLKRPNNREQDQHLIIEGTKTFIIEKSTLETGNYGVELRYEFDGKPCQQKTTVFIQK